MVARFGIANPGLPIADWQLPITLNFRIRSGYVSSAIANLQLAIGNHLRVRYTFSP
jgi:hypothetical protein